MDLFDYNACLKKVDSLFLELERASYHYPNINPPSITSSYDINYVAFKGHKNDPTLNYILKKIDSEAELEKLYHLLTKIYDTLCLDEKKYFVDCLLNHNITDEKFSEKMNISMMNMRKIKKSVVLKITEGLNISVLKGEV